MTDAGSGHTRRIPRFIAVGAAAALVHWGVVTAIVQTVHWHPLVANVLGWIVALQVSFFGHHRMTFEGHGVPLWRSASRFSAISAGGFVINELAYAAMLRWTDQSYQVSLVIVLLGVAVLTYLLSSRWAFIARSQE
ncbi:GtrA family protein [Roseateles sp. L2-2]|uniref:GtrA family protein n=1 Tax=Roseateles sp. L2-2 TaxID=3422597 RepID=UPI003D35BDD9